MGLKTILEEILSGRAIIIDIREKDEWDARHLKSAVHFPLSRIAKGEIPPTLSTDVPVYLHCAKGGRALMAAELLKKQFSNVIGLNIDFNEFHKNGFSVE